MAFTVVPAAEAGWDAVETVFLSEATSRDCWCQFHILTNLDWRDTTRQSRQELLKEQLATRPRGLVAFDNGEPVGWCGVEPRIQVRHVLASRIVVTSSPFALDDVGVWSIYCILVPPSQRRKRVGDRMLSAAVAHAVAAGATGLEGYPIDVAGRSGKLPPGFSTGTLSMFERMDFTPVVSLPSARTLVVRSART